MSPTPSPESECVSPLGPKGGSSNTTLLVRGCEGPNSDDWKESLVLCTHSIRPQPVIKYLRGCEISVTYIKPPPPPFSRRVNNVDILSVTRFQNCQYCKLNMITHVRQYLYLQRNTPPPRRHTSLVSVNLPQRASYVDLYL